MVECDFPGDKFDFPLKACRSRRHSNDIFGEDLQLNHLLLIPYVFRDCHPHPQYPMTRKSSRALPAVEYIRNDDLTRTVNNHKEPNNRFVIHVQSRTLSNSLHLANSLFLQQHTHMLWSDLEIRLWFNCVPPSSKGSFSFSLLWRTKQ